MQRWPHVNFPLPKLNHDKNPLNPARWLKREMWVARSGAVCYTSKLEGGATELYSPAEARDLRIEVLGPKETCQDHAFCLAPPSNKGQGSHQFAAESEEDMEAFLDAIRAFQDRVQKKSNKQAQKLGTTAAKYAAPQPSPTRVAPEEAVAVGAEQATTTAAVTVAGGGDGQQQEHQHKHHHKSGKKHESMAAHLRKMEDTHGEDHTHNMATKIQALHRGRGSRKMAAEVKVKRNSAASTIQSLHRGKQERARVAEKHGFRHSGCAGGTIVLPPPLPPGADDGKQHHHKHKHKHDENE